MGLRVCFARNFFHTKERFSSHDATSPSSWEGQVFPSWRKSLVCLSNPVIPKQRSVVTSRFRIKRKQYYSGSFAIETMYRHELFRRASFSQSDEKRFM